MSTLPRNPLGCWEDGRFIGVAIFSRCTNRNMGGPFGLETTEICELTRIALGIEWLT